MQSGRGRRWWILAGALLLALLLGACGDGGSDKPLDTFDPIGEEAKTIDALVRPVFYTAAVVFVLVEGAILYVMVRYRRRRKDGADDEWPTQSHGNVVLELGWTMLPAVVISVIGIATVATVFELETREPDAIDVSVYGHQWWWSFEYDVDGDGEVDFTTANEMVIPTGKQVNLSIHSRDVLHSFWIPKLNGKRDAVPNRVTTLSLETNEARRYRGQCTEFCGLSHARMQMWVDARSPEDYEAWLVAQMAPAPEPLTAEQAAGLEVYRTYCQSCHLVRGATTSEDGDVVTDVQTYRDNGGASALLAGWAPELTHFMSRQRFAGAIFELYDDDGNLNRAQLEAWIRNPQGVKPSAPDEGRGMPTLPLSEDEIDQVVAYLMTLQ